MMSSVLVGEDELTKFASRNQVGFVIEEKSNCCAMGVKAGPHLLLSDGGFSKLQITGKAKRESKLAA